MRSSFQLILKTQEKINKNWENIQFLKPGTNGNYENRFKNTMELTSVCGTLFIIISNTNFVHFISRSMHLMFIKSVYTGILILCIKSTLKKNQEFYFIIRFQTPSDYFEVNYGAYSNQLNASCQRVNRWSKNRSISQLSKTLKFKILNRS